MDEHIFSISVECVQLEAERYIDRRINENELSSVKKGLEWGLLYDFDTILKTAISNATDN